MNLIYRIFDKFIINNTISSKLIIQILNILSKMNSISGTYQLFLIFKRRNDIHRANMYLQKFYKLSFQNKTPLTRKNGNKDIIEFYKQLINIHKQNYNL